MSASIPASALVSIVPSVIGAGGTALDLSGLILTNSTRVPIGSVVTLNGAAAVSAYFGPASPEYAASQIYFLGFNTSTVKPNALLFAQYPAAPVAAYLRGGTTGLTLAQLQALAAGTVIVTVNGALFTSSSINLSAATSFSNAATIIQTAFTSPTFTVTYDSIAGAFVITSTTTGASSTITYGTGTLSPNIGLGSANGAVLSQGAIAAVPGTAMDAIVAQTQNWASFMTMFEPVTADCVAFAAWTNAQLDRFLYVMWDTDITATNTVPATASAGYIITVTNAYDGTLPIYCPDYTKAAFALGIGASLDFTRPNGRKTYAFRGQSGLAADVTNSQIASNLIANGYNFYGAYATAAQQFLEFQPGQISGKFDWADSYVNEIWMNNAFQLALMELLQQIGLLPYNVTGYGLVETALLDPIEAAVSFGAIQGGVTLSNAQIAEANALVGQGLDISGPLQNRGWYVSIAPATSQVRAARGSPPCTFIYVDGQSIQRLILASVQVQ